MCTSAATLPPPLVALTPATLTEARDARALIAAVESALAAGLRGLLLREPGLPDRAFLALARELQLRATAAGAWFAVHDRVHVALTVGADGVHLGFRSLPAIEVRALVPERTAVGSSAHAGDGEAQHEGADYLFLGPVLDTPSKRGLRAPVGFEGLAQGVRSARVPVLAIGGMRPADVVHALAAGACGVAVLGGILSDPEPARRTGEYLSAFTAAQRP